MRATRAYAPALDGLRALAVLGVLAYHAGWRAFPGGFLGVDVFLVLSGYLITTLLVEEWSARGRVSLGRFWERRIRRLVPALALVVAVVVAHAAATGAAATIRGDTWATLTWTQNWHLALSDASYFAIFGDASPLRHAWSLALEAQWYLVWPPVLLVLLRVTRGRLAAVAAAGALMAAASALLMAAGFSPTADPSRVYYGTDTRGHVLLIGAVLALLLHGRGWERAGAARWPRTVAGLSGAAIVGVAAHRLGDLDPGLYTGGFALVGVGTAALIVAALDPQAPLARLLSVEPLPALGRISYGVYLWHWPLYLWLGPTLVATGLAIAAAAASYWLVETPIRRAPAPRRRAAMTLSVAGAAAVAVVVTVVPLPPPVTAPAAASPLATPKVVGDPPDAPSDAGDERDDPATARPREINRVLVAGDSVGLTLSEHFRTEWVDGAFVVDGGATALGCGIVVGQPLNRGEPVLWSDPKCLEWKERWRARMTEIRPDAVVILIGAWEVMDRRIDGHEMRVGTESYAAYLRQQLDAAFDLVEDAGAHAVALTTPCFRPTDEVGGRSVSDRGDDGRVTWFNDVLRAEAGRHPSGVTVVDLHALVCPEGEQTAEVNGRPTFTDGMHFTPAGSEWVWSWLADQLGQT